MKRSAATMVVWMTAGLAVLAGPAFGVDLSASESAKLRQAQAAQGEGEHDKALELLEPIWKKHPREGDLIRLMAHSYFELGRLKEARDAAVTAIGLGRMSSDLLVRIAQIDRQRGDDLATLNTVRLLTVTQPDDVTWRMLYGDLLLSMGRADEAHAVYRRLVDADPVRADLWSRLGNAQIRQERLEQAAASFETAWHLGQRDASVAKILAGLHQRLGHGEATTVWVERAIAQGDEPDARDRLRQAQFLDRLGDTDRARAIALELTKSAPAEIVGQAWVLLGHMALRRGDPEAAVKHWQSAGDAVVQQEGLTKALGSLHFNQRRYAEAARFFALHLEQTPGDREVSLLRIRCELLSGKTAEARGHVLSHLEQFGMDPSLVPIIRQLSRQLGAQASSKQGD